MNPTAIIGALLALTGGSLPGKRRRQNTERPCLACGKPHRHNNAFCSPACCATYKEAKKEAGA